MTFVSHVAPMYEPDEYSQSVFKFIRSTFLNERYENRALAQQGLKRSTVKMRVARPRTEAHPYVAL